jgi:hypothetical protein
MKKKGKIFAHLRSRQLMKAAAIGWYVAMIAMAVLAIAGSLPEILISLPMGCLGFHAIREIREWWKL